VRRAVAIQLIINRELGLNFNENPWQGSFVVDELTDLVEEAVYKEFEAISERGGVLGAMDTMYQRGKIQEESLYYESKKHDGSAAADRREHVPAEGTRRRHHDDHRADPLDAGREGPADRKRRGLPREPQRASALAPSVGAHPVGDTGPENTRIPERSPEGAKSKAGGAAAVGAHPVGDSSTELAAHGIKTQSGDPKVPGTLTHLQGHRPSPLQPVLKHCYEAVKYNSLGQISHALYDVVGEYRRNM
jgi:methylmalonyl-CoA mutase